MVTYDQLTLFDLESYSSQLSGTTFRPISFLAEVPKKMNAKQLELDFSSKLPDQQVTDAMKEAA